ncbi:hypothetical protein DL89DRAFT_265316 [Linderina pennispora]|uniref:Uncharacterized protein n=1 Tax=Linderina pennispora TaxID=61395 RepID=A0A1Y1WI69_9FUNG|nr:uncharacterized protein DL89DRAFT_265316 [Linderina pennispora]ORX73172.1 hypothetical protein DL89DRAFT_265316 [Linderina pennispora]
MLACAAAFSCCKADFDPWLIPTAVVATLLGAEVPQQSAAAASGWSQHYVDRRQCRYPSWVWDAHNALFQIDICVPSLGRC